MTISSVVVDSEEEQDVDGGDDCSCDRRDGDCEGGDCTGGGGRGGGGGGGIVNLRVQLPIQYILWRQSTYIWTTSRPKDVLFEYVDPLAS